MAFAAPMVVEGAAAGGSAAAASGAGEAAGASRAATSGATSASTARSAPARAAVPSKTASARAGELTSSGTPRYKARRTLRHEYGATGEQADDLLDAAGGSPPADREPDDAPADTTRRSSGNVDSSRQLPRPIARAADAGGGLVLGVLTYVAGLVFLRGGWAGVREWLAAKFLNRVPGEQAAESAATDHAAPATPGGSNAGTGLKVYGSAPNAIGGSGLGAAGGGGGGW